MDSESTLPTSGMPAMHVPDALLRRAVADDLSAAECVRGEASMSDTTIHGLRFRRVTLVYPSPGEAYVGREVRASEACDAMVCRRCTTVVRDHGEAERHICMSSYWLMGVSFDELPAEQPDRPRERLRVVNHMPRANLWPHIKAPFDPRNAEPLSERYETLSVLLAELAKMQREIESRQRAKPRRRRRP